jgi:hypothetical protein
VRVVTDKSGRGAENRPVGGHAEILALRNTRATHVRIRFQRRSEQLATAPMWGPGTTGSVTACAAELFELSNPLAAMTILLFMSD